MEYDLERFLEAQDTFYKYVKEELASGNKQSHWMWFIFPQVKGLGFSPTADYYGITSADEAKAYLEHPVLGNRLLECSQLLLRVNGKTAREILGYPDDLKLRSSMTLFHLATGHTIFQEVLDKYYEGQQDEKTLEILKTV
jgi:uncharacterized protein (DUF1810 family)